MMRVLFFIAAVAGLSCNQSSPKGTADQPGNNSAKTSTGPVQPAPAEPGQPAVYVTPDEGTVNGLLQTRYGNSWHVMNDQEARWMKDAFDYFIVPKRKENRNYPYITKGDFNGDGKPDMAAVVTDSSKQLFRIAIITGKDNIIFWEEDVLVDAALTTIPKSDIEGMDGEKTKKVKLKGDGINVEYFEKASFVLYWDKTSFKRIKTGD